MVILHPHKGGFQICFGIAVAVSSHNLKALFISHKTFAAGFQFFIKLLNLRFPFSFPINKRNLFLLCDLRQIFLEFQDLQWGAVIDLNDRMIRQLFMFCQFSLPILFNDIPYFVHPFHHEHMGMGDVIFDVVFIFIHEKVIFLVQGINRIQ